MTFPRSRAVAKKYLEPKTVGLSQSLTKVAGKRVWAEPEEKCWRQEEHWSSLGQFRSSQLTFVHRLEEQCHGAGDNNGLCPGNCFPFAREEQG